MDEERAELDAAQRRLVDALTGSGAAPEGFDASRVALATKMLLNKRRHGVEKMWPRLAIALGARFAELFAEYARKQTLSPRDQGAFADGKRFAEWLQARGELPDAGKLELLAARAMRGLPVRCARAEGRLWVAVRLPTRVRIFKL